MAAGFLLALVKQDPQKWKVQPNQPPEVVGDKFFFGSCETGAKTREPSFVLVLLDNRIAPGGAV